MFVDYLINPRFLDQPIQSCVKSWCFHSAKVVYAKKEGMPNAPVRRFFQSHANKTGFRQVSGKQEWLKPVSKLLQAAIWFLLKICIEIIIVKDSAGNPARVRTRFRFFRLPYFIFLRKYGF